MAAHVEVANRLLGRTRSTKLASEVAAAASEDAGFAACLHVEMRDIGTARYYRLAIDRAY